MKKKIIIAIIIAIGLCSFIFFIHHFLLGSWTSDNIHRYIELTECNNVLPKMNELGEYSGVDFQYFRKNMLMFFSDAYILKLSYNQENYQKEKAKWQETRNFETKKLIDDGGYEKEPSFELDPYHFQMLSYANYDLQAYPHEMVFVGLSDKKQEIAIVYYWDTDLDYIDTDFAEFLKSECGWK